jgi:DNA-binding MarR family transcriptional regulator
MSSELPLRFLLAFRTMIDELHAELAEQGHPDVRPMHGFVLQAIGPQGTTAVELGRLLGVSKQAAGKTVETLERLGYVERAVDPSDTRRKIVKVTDRGYDVLIRSGAILRRQHQRWAQELGTDRLEALESDLRKMTPENVWSLDVPGWFG